MESADKSIYGLKTLKRHYLARQLGMLFTACGVGLLYADRHIDTWWAWAFVGYAALVHPLLWYGLARYSRARIRVEFLTMILDAALFGHFIAMMSFSLWPTFTLLIVCMINSLTGATNRIFALSLLALAASAEITALVVGFRPQPESPLVVSLVCIATLLAYVWQLARHASSSMQDLRDSRQQVRRQADDLHVYNQQLRQSIDDLTQAHADLNASEKTRIAAEVRERIKTTLLSTMSHELRTPMNGIMGMISVMQGTSLSPEQQQYCDIARDSADTLMLQLDDILDYARLELNDIKLDCVSFDLRDVLEDVMTMTGEHAHNKGIDLTYHHDGAIQQQLMGDPLRVQQIFKNLTSNAIKFTTRGYIRTRCRLLSDTHENYRLRIEVEDSGIGLAKETQDRLFNAFVMADPSNQRKQGGMGLGLALCSQLVRHMNGDIGVLSELGKGSTFWVEIPFRKSVQKSKTRKESPPSLRQDGPQLSLARPGNTRKILVVEDNKVNQLVAVTRLEKLGYDVEIANDGKAAVEAFQRQHYALILMDCQMPVMDGFEATTLIRQLESRHVRQHTPIIALTAHVAPEDMSLCLQVGMDGFLRKPLKQQLLVEALDQWLDMGQAQDATVAPGL